MLLKEFLKQNFVSLYKVMNFCQLFSTSCINPKNKLKNPKYSECKTQRFIFLIFYFLFLKDAVHDVVFENRLLWFKVALPPAYLLDPNMSVKLEGGGHTFLYVTLCSVCIVFLFTVHSSNIWAKSLANP